MHALLARFIRAVGREHGDGVACRGSCSPQASAVECVCARTIDCPKDLTSSTHDVVDTHQLLLPLPIFQASSRRRT